MGKMPKLCHNTPLSIFSLGKGRESLCLKPYIKLITSALSDLPQHAMIWTRHQQRTSKLPKICIFFTQILHLSSNRRERNLAHLFPVMTPARKLTHTTKFKCFWMQKDTNFRNTIILRHLGPENCQNPTQKDTNFGNTIIIRHLGPENRQNPTQKDTNFGNTIIICHLGPENRQNPTQKDKNFRNTIIIRHLGPENHQIKPRKTRILRKCTH